MRTCEYENCNKELTGRNNQKFCCKNHRVYNSILEKRRIVKLKKDKQSVNNIIDNFKSKDASLDIIELYKKIYSK